MCCIICPCFEKCMKWLDSLIPERFQAFWNHPAGPKTIFFWAPTFKWGLVLAGLGDMLRPAHLLSWMQTVAIMLTGVIWARYSVVIIPVNYNLLSVNLFVAITQGIQLVKIIIYEVKKSKEDDTVTGNLTTLTTNTSEILNSTTTIISSIISTIGAATTDGNLGNTTLEK